jgi:hypothetical protein
MNMAALGKPKKTPSEKADEKKKKAEAKKERDEARKKREEASQSRDAKSKAEAKRAAKAKKAGTANTGPIFYFSNKTVKGKCDKEKKAIKKACDEEKDKSKAEARKAKASNTKLGAVTEKVQDGLNRIEGAVKEAYGYKTPNDDNRWMGEHCHGLWVKPRGGADQFDKFQGELKKIEDGIKADMTTLTEAAAGKVLNMAKDKAIAYGEKAALREAAAATTLVAPVVGEVVVVGMTIWNVVDGVWTAGKIAMDVYDLAKKAKEQYDKLKPQLETIQKLLAKKKEFTPSSILADMMTSMATANPCIMARRCSLVPFEKTEGSGGLTSGKEQATSGQGCCPGQTGHHVMPGAMFEAGNNPCGKPYKHEKAPVICLEGANNHVGSHGLAHTGLQESIDAYKKANPGKQISYKEASARAIGAVRLSNPLCSKECLQAQLDRYYKDGMQCRDDAKLKPNAGMSDPVEDSSQPAPVKTKTSSSKKPSK